MMMQPPNEPTNCEPEALAPEKLAADLAALYASEVPVPREADEQVLAAARRHFARHRRPRRLTMWLAAAAAAALVLVAVGPLLFHQPRQPSSVGERGPGLAARAKESEAVRQKPSGKAKPASSTAAKEDIDRDGQVDILDAFALARTVKAGGEREAEWDMNGDGKVDAADVDLVARAAVDTRRGSRQ